jgi:simple sugar transport system ATP-binding protein
MDKKPLIEIKNLVKKFGAFTALNGVSLDVYPGEVHALLGRQWCRKINFD